VHIRLFYFTIKLQSNTHLTYYSYNNKKDLKLNLDRALGGQLIKIGYLLKITIEPIGNNRGSADRIGKGGNLLISVWKRNRQERSLYMSRRLADLSSPGVKSADIDRNVKGTVLQG
jgi:hypothetical protein